MTQINNKFFDEFTKLATGAVSAAGGVYDEVKEMAKNQGEKIVNDMELVRREDFDVVKEMVSRLVIENEKLTDRVSVLEEKLDISADS